MPEHVILQCTRGFFTLLIVVIASWMLAVPLVILTMGFAGVAAVVVIFAGQVIAPTLMLIYGLSSRRRLGFALAVPVYLVSWMLVAAADRLYVQSKYMSQVSTPAFPPELASHRTLILDGRDFLLHPTFNTLDLLADQHIDRLILSQVDLASGRVWIFEYIRAPGRDCSTATLRRTEGAFLRRHERGCFERRTLDTIPDGLVIKSPVIRYNGKPGASGCCNRTDVYVRANRTEQLVGSWTQAMVWTIPYWPVFPLHRVIWPMPWPYRTDPPPGPIETVWIGRKSIRAPWVASEIYSAITPDLR